MFTVCAQFRSIHAGLFTESARVEALQLILAFFAAMVRSVWVAALQALLLVVLGIHAIAASANVFLLLCTCIGLLRNSLSLCIFADSQRTRFRTVGGPAWAMSSGKHALLQHMTVLHAY